MDSERGIDVDSSPVELGAERYPVRRTPKRSLRQVDFVFDGNEIRGLEQYRETKSRWAQMACSGKKVMQFLSEGRYVAVVVDGKVKLYGGRSRTSWRGFLGARFPSVYDFALNCPFLG